MNGNNSIKKKIALVLGGGSDQIALILELKKSNYKVVLLDYLENPPAKSIADKHIQESTLDVETVKEAALKEKVDLVCTACTDQALLTVAKVSEELHLPCYLTYRQALDVTNKFYMKDLLMANNIPTANYISISDSTEISKLADLEYPLVVKPADCNSSKGVLKVTSPVQLDSAVKNAFSLSRSSKVIIEEFKDGIEISADFYVSGEDIILLSATSSIKVKNTNNFTIIGSSYPVVNEEESKKLVKIAKQIVETFKLRDTPLLIQLIKKDSDFFVIEFSARMGGGSKYQLIEEISGVNIMAEYCNLILNEDVNIDPTKSEQNIKMIYIYTYPGTISSIEGLNRLSKEGIITKFFLYKSLPCTIEKAETSSDRILGLLIKANSIQEMNQKIRKMNEEIKILNLQNMDLARHDFILSIIEE